MAEHIYIKFYGISDFTSRTHLHETEAIIRDWDKYIKDADINSVSELYNIKKYFDAGARLDCWNDEQYNGFLENAIIFHGLSENSAILYQMRILTISMI